MTWGDRVTILVAAGAITDWRLVEENQRAALAAIVHGISRLDAAGHWGDGTTSASDGQRFAMPQKVLQRTYSTRFNDFALVRYPSIDVERTAVRVRRAGGADRTGKNC